MIVLSLAGPAVAQKTDAVNRSWKKTLKDRTKRGTLRDVQQFVRGDTGKWNDRAGWNASRRFNVNQARYAARRLGRSALRKRSVQFKPQDDNWLLFHSRQLNDNDRIWIESIERKGNRFTIVAAEAVWQGRYRKNFTFHTLLGVNLGKLGPGKYAATWIVKSLAFDKFERPSTPRNARNNWPKDDRAADRKPTELTVTFRIGPVPR